MVWEALTILPTASPGAVAFPAAPPGGVVRALSGVLLAHEVQL